MQYDIELQTRIAIYAMGRTPSVIYYELLSTARSEILRATQQLHAVTVEAKGSGKSTPVGSEKGYKIDIGAEKGVIIKRETDETSIGRRFRRPTTIITERNKMFGPMSPLLIS